MNKNICFIILFFGTLLSGNAVEILVKRVTSALALPAGVRMRECNFYITEEMAAKQPSFDPLNDNSYFPMGKALGLAFKGYFEKNGISSDRFCREVQVSIEKADDYSSSAVAKAVRSHGPAIRDLWFYVIRCDYMQFGQVTIPPAPILVLMDGTMVVPVEQIVKVAGTGK
jgi:hypothetical protein